MEKSNFDTGYRFCPADCPFLSPRSFIENVLPFYCDKYDTYLPTAMGKILKCGRCLGEARSVSERGKLLIESMDNAPVLLAQFNQMDHFTQQMFVELVSKTGQKFSGNDTENLTDRVLLFYKNYQEYIGSPDVKDLKGLLDKVGDNFPDLLTKSENTLLMNLYYIFDSSEKQILKNILQNEGATKSFLTQFSKQPKDNDLVRNVRSVLYEYDRPLDKAKEKTTEQQRKLDIERIKSLKERDNSR